MILRRLSFLPLLLAPVLGGCSTVVISPAGDVARQQSNMILWSTGLMLLIIVPVMALTALFAWKYRAGNEDAEYAPDWDHSTGLELIIWSAPLLIVIALGAMTWTGTHLLDPYRPLAPGASPRSGEEAPARGAQAAATTPLEIEVVSLDWKWLFIYPEQGVATVNRLVVPVDRPVHFRMTSSSVMNTFWVPSMAGMIYTMPGMETQLHAVLNRVGEYEGRSANYSGAGFSGMTFRTFALAPGEFDAWIGKVRGSALRMDLPTYARLVRPSENVPAIAFGGVDQALYKRILMQCAVPGTECMGMHGTNRPMQPSQPTGALRRPAEDKGSAPHSTAPRPPAAGNRNPGAPTNRDMTMIGPDELRRADTRNA